MRLKYYFLFFIVLYFSQNEGAKLPAKADVQPKTIKKVQEMCVKYAGYKYTNRTIDAFILGDPPRIQSTLNCTKLEPLIVGGKNATSKEFPHMALIGYGATKKDIKWNCGGSLISERYVLSAAHCNHGLYGKPTWVRLGELDLSTTNPQIEDSQDYSIIEINEHLYYDSKKIYHDITLYKLHEIVKFNAFIRPLCLYPNAEFVNSTRTKSVITGWGSISTGAYESDILQKASVKLIENEKCEKSFNKTVDRFPEGFKSKFQLCAGDLETGSDTCQGDSGGPLQIPIPNEICMFYLIGITSVGNIDCGDHINPGVYTKVWIYLDWIQGIVWPD